MTPKPALLAGLAMMMAGTVFALDQAEIAPAMTLAPESGSTIGVDDEPGAELRRLETQLEMTVKDLALELHADRPDRARIEMLELKIRQLRELIDAIQRLSQWEADVEHTRRQLLGAIERGDYPGARALLTGLAALDASILPAYEPVLRDAYRALTFCTTIQPIELTGPAKECQNLVRSLLLRLRTK
jgi:hypothetical protein